jgi:hypothetical protein
METSNNQFENKKKIRRIENSVFILNMNSIDNYKNVDPNELIIINTEREFSQKFMNVITSGKIKFNVKKIITSDSIIIKYIKNIQNIFLILFPNCTSIQINSLENNFNLISTIIDNTKIIKNIEYILNDNIKLSNSLYKYKLFTETFLTGNLLNIKKIKIIKNITIDTECAVEKNNIDNIVDFNLLQTNNNYILQIIEKYGISSNCINYINLEYINMNKNINRNTILLNTVDDICFLTNNFL